MWPVVTAGCDAPAGLYICMRSHSSWVCSQVWTKEAMDFSMQLIDSSGIGDRVYISDGAHALLPLHLGARPQVHCMR